MSIKLGISVNMALQTFRGGVLKKDTGYQNSDNLLMIEDIA